MLIASDATILANIAISIVYILLQRYRRVSSRLISSRHYWITTALTAASNSAWMQWWPLCDRKYIYYIYMHASMTGGVCIYALVSRASSGICRPISDRLEDSILSYSVSEIHNFVQVNRWQTRYRWMVAMTRPEGKKRMGKQGNMTTYKQSFSYFFSFSGKTRGKSRIYHT